MKAQSKSADDEGQNNPDDESGAKGRANIGVAAFFIAKRAAKKMIKYWKRHKDDEDKRITKEKE